MAAGAVGYLVKDCSIDEITETLRNAVSSETIVSSDFLYRL